MLTTSRWLAFSLLWLATTAFLSPARYHRQWKQVAKPPTFGLRTRLHSTTQGEEFVISSTSHECSDGGTVLRLDNPSTGQLVTLIGTAHLSKKSNEQVTAIIESTNPDVVMIELDAARLERVGLTTETLPLPFATADGIEPPPTEDDKDFARNLPWWNPARELLLDAVTSIARSGLTAMYDGLSDRMGDDVVGGGEFLAAIRAAESIKPACRKIVLGDRDSFLTLRRAADLALRSGDPLGVLRRLSDANQAEIESLDAAVREALPPDADEAEATAALIEAIKADAGFRSRVFARLEEEVPEFTQSFLTERDYVMAEVIRRETGAEHVVAVIGLAHLPGVASNLRAGVGGMKEGAASSPVGLVDKSLVVLE